jgi:hypothetical protein
MDKDTLAIPMFMAFSSMVQRSFYDVARVWEISPEKNFPNFDSFNSILNSSNDAVQRVAQAMVDYIVIAFRHELSESQLAFFREACIVCVKSQLTLPDRYSCFKAVEDFCLSRYAECESS